MRSWGVRLFANVVWPRLVFSTSTLKLSESNFRSWSIFSVSATTLPALSPLMTKKRGFSPWLNIKRIALKPAHLTRSLLATKYSQKTEHAWVIYRNICLCMKSDWSASLLAKLSTTCAVAWMYAMIRWFDCVECSPVALNSGISGFSSKCRIKLSMWSPNCVRRRLA